MAPTMSLRTVASAPWAVGGVLISLDYVDIAPRARQMRLIHAASKLTPRQDVMAWTCQVSRCRPCSRLHS